MPESLFWDVSVDPAKSGPKDKGFSPIKKEKNRGRFKKLVF